MEQGILRRFVIGFAFSENRQEVLLIKKERSRSGFEWMIGKLNGLGGMIHGRENPFLAMSREFGEESGICTNPLDWEWCGKYGNGCDYEVIVFRILTDAVYKPLRHSEEGEVVLMRVADLSLVPCVPNLSWLVPLLLKPNLQHFMIGE